MALIAQQGEQQGRDGHELIPIFFIAAKFSLGSLRAHIENMQAEKLSIALTATAAVATLSRATAGGAVRSIQEAIGRPHLPLRKRYKTVNAREGGLGVRKTADKIQVSTTTVQKVMKETIFAQVCALSRLALHYQFRIINGRYVEN